MANDIVRRCGCRDDSGKQYGARCPKLVSDPKHGTWGYYVAGGTDPVTGKRVQHRKTGFNTKKAAQEARNKVAVKTDQGTYVAPTREKFGEYVVKWLLRHANTGRGLKPTTLFNYQRYVDNDILHSALARIPLSEVRRHHLDDFIAALSEEGRGATTVRRIVAVLQAALRAAYDSGKIDHNPAYGVKLPLVEKKEFHAWEPEQVGHFLDVAALHRLGPMFELAMFTGLRRGELVGLRWLDVDMIGKAITVRNNRVQAGRKVVENNTKTRAGRRIVELDERSIGALIAWQIKQGEERDAGQEAYEQSVYVFTMEDGRPLKPEYATKLFEKIRSQAKLPKLSLHGTRHEHAALMISSGADIAVVSKRLGHSSINITSDIYGHLVGSASRAAAEQASALVPARKPAALTSHTQTPV